MQKTQVLLIDDLDGTEGHETLAFTFDNTSYEIDLSAENASVLREVTEPYRSAARKVAVSRGTGRRSTAARQESAEVRAWAKQHGIPVSERGRIPSETIAAYKSAH